MGRGGVICYGANPHIYALSVVCVVCVEGWGDVMRGDGVLCFVREGVGHGVVVSCTRSHMCVSAYVCLDGHSVYFYIYLLLLSLSPLTLLPLSSPLYPSPLTPAPFLLFPLTLTYSSSTSHRGHTTLLGGND